MTEVDKLIGEQKYSEALAKVQKLITEMKTKKNDREWAALIIQEAKLQIGLHGYETAVRDLKEREWPKSDVAHALVSLAYARTLQIYHQAYSWEIRTRTKITGNQKFDLKSMTSDEIYQDAYEGFEKAWKVREELGKLRKDAFPEIISPNNYPDGIRGSLRDTLSYLISEFLTDSTGWTTQESNSTYTLNLKNLLNKSVNVALTDKSVHPVVKISHVLQDLEAWNRSQNKIESALEARLQLHKYLATHFTSQSSKNEIRSSLEQIIKKEQSNQWVTMAYGQLANLIRNDDDLVLAHSWASKGAKLFTKSHGAALCRDIISEIELPSLALDGMNIDATSKRSVLINYKNLKKVYFRTYKIDYKKFIESTKDYSLRPGWRELDSYLKQKPVKQWESELKETTDYKLHRSFTTPPAHDKGFYVVFVSSSPEFNQGVVQGIELFFSDNVFQVSSNLPKGGFDVEVLRGDNGQPVKGAVVSMYAADYQNGHKRLTSEKTDGEGLASMKAKSFLSRNSSFFFLVEKDGQLIASRNAHYFYDHGNHKTEVREAFIYTDRSIYRPEQKIFWKVIPYTGDPEKKNFSVIKNQDVTVELRDANFEVVQKVTVKSNSYGSASGEFVIPKGKLLGNWSISSTRGGNASLKVEEYKRPTFIVEFDEKGTEFRLNKEATVKGSVKYFFGMPLTKGTAKWTVNRRTILPWWCFWGGFNWGNVGAGNSEFISSGVSPIKEDGSFTLTFKPESDEDAPDSKDVTYNYSVKVDVTDEGGETQSAEISNTIGLSAVTGTINFSEKFLLAKTKNEVSIHRTDLNGKPLSGKGKWRIVKLVEPKTTLPPSEIHVPEEIKNLSKGKTLFEDDLKATRWGSDYSVYNYLREWKDGKSISEGEVNHASNGKAVVAIPSLEEGSYRIYYETKDKYGSNFEGKKEFLVVSSKTQFPLPGIMLLQKDSVEVGETARIFVTSGFPNHRIVFDTHRSGKLLKRRILTSGADNSLIEIPIKEEDRGGLSFSARLITDYQYIPFMENVLVPWTNKMVDVSFSTLRNKLRPGTNETFSITIKGKNKRKIEAETFEILSYMYDKSLDSLNPHQVPFTGSIFPTYFGATNVQSELGAGTLVYTNINHFYPGHEYRPLAFDQFNFYPNYGVGGPGARGRGGFGGLVGRSKGMMESASMMDMAKSEAVPQSAPAAEPQMKKANSVDKESSPKTQESELRTNFSETAFWKPHLIPGKDGTVSFEFKVPDSVTSWSVWAHAVSKDLQSGSISEVTQTIKELMVRPYLPRFFREGDEAEIKLVINNSSEKDLEGTATFELIDELSKASLNKEFGLSNGKIPFKVKSQGSTNVSVKLKVPAGIKNVVVKAIASSGNFSDGEVRPLPVLPGRVHLAQSKFVTLHNKDKAELTFADLMKNNDPSFINDLFVVTLDAQLFYSVLSSLPYLINYPYQSTEQMLNAFVSSGIVSSVFSDFPEVGKMARKLSERKTRVEKWDDADPNRKLTLEEAPWLSAARGNDAGEDEELITILHPDIARNTRNKFLKLLKNSQTASGGFPWFPGGPPSTYVTLYILHGFSKAIEFGVDVPKDVTAKAWGYLHSHYVNELTKIMMSYDTGWEFITFLNYVLSSYPDNSWSDNVFSEAEKKFMLDFSMKHWKEHSPYLKSYLSMTLTRAKRSKEAKLVWDSVMDSAKTTKEEGTHWAQEDRSWLWYNDQIETHAMALRTGSELGTKHETLDGLVHWIFLNKKLNQWKSTRATSEVIYSLTHYLKKTKQLGIKEEIKVQAGGKETKFEFNPDKYTGKKNQIVFRAQDVSPKLLPVKVEKTTDGLAFASATWHYSTEKLPSTAVGDFLKINRTFFKRISDKSGVKLVPLKDGAGIEVGDEVEVHLSLSSKHPVEYVHLRDPRAAGFEPVDAVSGHKWEFGIVWYEEIRDSGTNFFFEQLPKGQYNFRYKIRASTAGKFRAGPATIQPLYAPEFVGFSEGHELTIKQQK